MNFIYNKSIYQSDFEKFKIKFPDWEDKFGVYDRDRDNTYKRIKCIWKENENIQHECHAVINVKTGGIYIDCRRRKIFAKNAGLILIRPLYTMIKTAWHASIIGPIAREIFKTVIGIQSPKGGKRVKQTAKEGLKNFGVSMLDIGLTPLCGIVMTITSIAMVILSPFSPNILYRGRDLIGCFERLMHHQEDLRFAEFPVQSFCFSPIYNISQFNIIGKKQVALSAAVPAGLETSETELVETGSFVDSDTDSADSRSFLAEGSSFDSLEETLDSSPSCQEFESAFPAGTAALSEKSVNAGIEHVAEHMVRNVREHRFICNDFGKLYPKGVPYVSAAASKS